MILIDANLLLYAYDSSSPNHPKARRWFEEIFSQSSLIGLSWVTILAFLRISTNSRAFQSPFSTNEALTIVSEWLAQAHTSILNPGERHWEILSTLARTAQARGPLLMDAHLAALAMENGATLCTSDKDFSRFPKLKTYFPLET
jgi:uncharacterized protein